MRLLLLEDDVTIADFVKNGLNDAGFQSDHFITANDARSAALQNQYDLAIFDVGLPDVDGFTLVKELRTLHVSIPIIFLSAKRNVHERIEGLNVGADDYITKPFSMDELLARVNALLRRSAPSEQTMLSFEDLSMNLLTRKVERSGESIELQSREFNLLELFVRSQGKPISKNLILEKIFGYHFNPRTNVVDVLVCRLRRKIDDEFDRKILHTLRGIGYVLK